MKKILVFAIFALVAHLPAQNLFNPLSQLLLPGGGTNPQSGANAGNSNSPAVALGGAIGGMLGSKKQKTAEGTVIGSALGLIFGQMLGGNSQNSGLLPQGPANANLPQIDPATGLPIGGPGQLGPRSATSKPQLSPRKRVNKLFGR